MLQNVLITGTSSGFGRLTALALAGRGHRVFATMRDPDGKNREHAARLREVPGIEVLALDVTSESSVEAAVASALKSAGHLDAVINNAGLATIGLAETITPAQLLRLFDTNVVGVQRVNRAVLPSMRARKSGLLVHVSSGLGRIVIPLVGLYGSTKFALESLSDEYRYDLKGCGVEVTVVQPGAYPTELGSVDPDGADQERAKGYGPMAGALEGFHVRAKAMKSNPDAANPQQVADAIVRLIEAPPGRRPARVAIDASNSPFVPRLNEAHAQVQRELLETMGMGALAEVWAHRQHPLGSGFGPAATADEVLAGIDLTGKNVIVTGGHAGLGLEVTRALSKAGASVTVGARDPVRAAAAVAGLERVEVSQLDLIDPGSIRAFALRWLGTARPLHILVNSVGASGGPVRDARGFETQFATNHLGHFQLTVDLLPALRAAGGARVVNVSSGAQRFSDIRWDDPNFTEGYNSRAAYAQSKTANVLFAVELDRRWSKDGIRGYAVHPGVVVGTKLNSSAGEEALRTMGLIDERGQPIIDPARGKKTPQQGASTIVFAATSPLLSEIGGVYLKDNDVSALDDVVRPVTAQSIPSEVMSHSIDPGSARRLWELSERLLGA